MFTYFIVLLLINAILTTIIVTAGMSVRYLFQAIGGLGQVYPVILHEYFFGGGIQAIPLAVFVFLFAGGIAGVFICSAWLHLFFWLLGGRNGYMQTLKSLMYGLTPTLLLGWVPYISFIVPVWSLVLEFLEIRDLQEMPAGTAVAAVLVAIVIAVIAIIVISCSPLFEPYTLSAIDFIANFCDGIVNPTLLQE